MPMMTMIRMTLVAVVAGIPNRYCNPPAICSAPKPSDTASPNRVASTATMSTAWPKGPQTDLPISGKNPERSVSGMPRLKQKNASDKPATA